MNSAPRGPGTFRRIEDHPGDKTVVELAVDYAGPGAAGLTTHASRWRGGHEMEELWRKG
jgi:hypothetical protein